MVHTCHIVQMVRCAFVVLALSGALGGVAPQRAVALQIEPGTGSSLPDGKISVGPAAEAVPASPGEVVQRTVTIANRTADEVVIALELSEAVGSADVGEIVEVRHGIRAGAAAWARLESERVRIPAGGTAQVQLTIRIPRKPPAGSHVLAVSATQAPSSASTGALQPSFRLTALFIVNLPGKTLEAGEVTKLSLTHRVAMSGDVPVLRFTYRNTGHRMLRVTGEVRSRRRFGGTDRYKLEPLTVYPQGAARAEVRMTGLGDFGYYTNTLDLQTDSQAVPRATRDVGTLWVVPAWWPWALAAVGIILINVLGRRYLRSRAAYHDYDDVDLDAWEDADELHDFDESHDHGGR